MCCILALMHPSIHVQYKITCDKNGDGTAYLWAATTNDTSFSVDDLDGAKELEDEGEEEGEERRPRNKSYSMNSTRSSSPLARPWTRSR